jgi:hypothetical protein
MFKCWTFPRCDLNPLFIGLALLLALLLVWWGVRSRAAQRDEAHATDGLDTVAAWPPQATRVLTTAEREVYDLLRSALPAHMVLAQVPIQRFIKVPTRNSYAEWLRRVGQLSVDLVVCDRHSQVIAIVEVQAADEPVSGRVQRRRERLLRVLKAAEIPVHVWSASSLPTVQAAREAIAPSEAVQEDVAVPPTARSLPGRLIASATNPFQNLPPPPEEGLREAPPSTWFDDLDTGPTPLATEPPTQPSPHKDRPAR